MACLYPIEVKIAYGASGLPLKGLKPAFTRKSAEWIKTTFPQAELREVSMGCGRCLGCRKTRATFWGIRCYHEWLWHRQRRLPVVMATLTYRDEDLPPRGDLRYSDVQGFWSRLRAHLRRGEERKAKAEGRAPDFSRSEFRYIVAGEYGPERARPHWHALIFGVAPDDLKWDRRGSKGHPNHDSPSWSALWGKGFTTFDLAEEEARAFYVSGYAMKSAGLMTSHRFAVDEKWVIPEGQKRNVPFYEMTVDGERVIRHQEFARMSQDPPIGYRWFQEFYRDIFPHDKVRIFEREFPVPRVYYEWLAEIDPDMAIAVAHKRQAFLNDPAEVERREVALSWNIVMQKLACMEDDLKRKGHVSE